MSEDTQIAKLRSKLRSELKYRLVVYASLVAFFSCTTWLNVRKTIARIELISTMDVPPNATPETVRWAAVQGMIPIMTSMLVVACGVAAIGYCVMELLRPRTEAKLLLAMTERDSEDKAANKAAEPTNAPAGAHGSP